MATEFRSLIKYEAPVAIRHKSNEAPATGEISDAKITDADDLLNTILPPRRYTQDHALWVQSVSKSPATRHDVTQLQSLLDRELEQRKARETGICPIRQELYSQCFDELIRQVTINCTERGVLLLRIRNELKMTIKAYQTLFESGIAFGLRKIVTAENVKRENEEHTAKIEAENAVLKNQVLEWKNRCSAIERREAERREQEVQKHKEEVEYLEHYAQQLRQQLEALTEQI